MSLREYDQIATRRRLATESRLWNRHEYSPSLPPGERGEIIGPCRVKIFVERREQNRIN